MTADSRGHIIAPCMQAYEATLSRAVPAPEDSVMAASWRIPSHQAGGEYTLKVVHDKQGFPPAGAGMHTVCVCVCVCMCVCILVSLRERLVILVAERHLSLSLSLFLTHLLTLYVHRPSAYASCQSLELWP
jgi:hypothetical protein